MPAVQPLHLPRVERRGDRLRSSVYGLRSEGLADDGDSAPGRGRTCGACDHAALKTYVRVGSVRLDYCAECDAVTIVADAFMH